MKHKKELRKELRFQKDSHNLENLMMVEKPEDSSKTSEIMESEDKNISRRMRWY